jgi:two-component sensor histidine kinase
MEQVAAAIAEAHHRIANSLALLAGLVRLKARATRARDRLSASEFQRLLEDVAVRLAAVARLHRFLSQMPLEGSAPLRPYLRAICEDMIAAFSSPEQPLTVTHTGGDCQVPVRHVHDLALILCEIFINALKHAHPRGGPLAMRVDCMAGADSRAILTVSDDGEGLPAGFDPLHQGGLGFQVIRGLAAGMGAPLEIASGGPGLAFRLRLPAAARPC